MSHPYVHAESSVKLFGGKVEDYIEIHSWYDASKAWCPDWRHRAMRHHIEGIQECISVFGETILNSDSKTVSVYDIGVQHQVEDIGFVPTAKDWMDHFDEKQWKTFQNKKTQERIHRISEMEQHVPTSLKEAFQVK